MNHDSEIYKEVRNFIYRNARAIDLALWRYHFEDGSPDGVEAMLLFYQNEDGGFGHALESDNWNEHSTPYTTCQAIETLQAVGLNDMNRPIWKGIMRYLREETDMCGDGWPFSISTNDEYPHAPWWNYDPKANQTENLGLTATLAASVLRYLPCDTDVYQKSLQFAQRLPELIKGGQNMGDMGVGGLIKLAQTIRELRLPLTLDEVELKAIVTRAIEHDSSKWHIYGCRPSDLIRTPDSPYYADNKEIVETELAYLLKTRPKGGVWGITWTWFDNMPKYAGEFAISENWWKCVKAIEKMLFLRSFGKLD